MNDKQVKKSSKTTGRTWNYISKRWKEMVGKLRQEETSKAALERKSRTKASILDFERASRAWSRLLVVKFDHKFNRLIV